MQQPGTDLSYSTVPGAPRSDKTFFGLHLDLAGNYCENPKVPGAQLNVNPGRAITWFVNVTIYCTFFNNNSTPPRQFLCNEILLKKISYSKGMLIEQIFKLRWPGPPGRICVPITSCFHDKTIISKQNTQLHCYTAKILQEAMYLTSPYLGQITYKI